MVEALAILWLIQATPGKDHSSSPLHDWYKSLLRPTYPYASCCDVSDCRSVQARTATGRWEAEIDGDWVPVPENVILKRADNPTGNAVACYFAMRTEKRILWYCFVAPAMI